MIATLSATGQYDNTLIMLTAATLQRRKRLERLVYESLVINGMQASLRKT